MYKQYSTYNEWKNVNLENGKKFFYCDIANGYVFTYWSFEPKEIKRGE